MRRIIVLGGLIIILGMGVYPPWLMTAKMEGSPTFVMPHRYGFLFPRKSPTVDKGVVIKYAVDLKQLGLQWVLVIVGTTGVLMSLPRLGRSQGD